MNINMNNIDESINELKAGFARLMRTQTEPGKAPPMPSIPSTNSIKEPPPIRTVSHSVTECS